VDLLRNVQGKIQKLRTQEKVDSADFKTGQDLLTRKKDIRVNQQDIGFRFCLGTLSKAKYAIDSTGIPFCFGDISI
jgi:hypothetical protein